jgi:hypothetical protein
VKVVVVGNLATEWNKVEAGVFQGSVLGPILLILFIADINQYIPSGCNIMKYADDILAYVLGKFDICLPQRGRRLVHSQQDAVKRV